MQGRDEQRPDQEAVDPEDRAPGENVDAAPEDRVDELAEPVAGVLLELMEHVDGQLQEHERQSQASGAPEHREDEE